MDAAIDIAARISGATTDVATRVTGAIRDAARATGAGFEYLLNTAMRESSLNPNAKAKNSSATGLFQFIDQTWLGTMKQSGASLGYGKYADAITRTPQGKFVVSDPAMRREIMALRKDPTANSLMAGAFANSNAKVLTDRLGRKPTDGELYMAHFLGASGAARFIKCGRGAARREGGELLSARRAGEFLDLLRQAGRGAQPQAGLRRAGGEARRDRHDARRRREAGRAGRAGEIRDRNRRDRDCRSPPRRSPSSATFRQRRRNATAVTPVSATAAVTAINAATASAPVPTPRCRWSPRRAPSSAARNRCSSRFISRKTAARSGRWCASCGARGACRRSIRRMPLLRRRETSASGGANVNAPLDLFQFLRPSARRPA